jgi:cytochrome c oxidase accessory protein FixG
MARDPDAPNLDRMHVINKDGSRRDVHPADVKGRFSNMKPWVYGVLIFIYAAMPWVRIDGKPAIHIDIAARKFFLFGEIFNAQDFYLMFSLLTGIGFTLIFLSAIFGRVWCGWACPQTVFLEGVFRKIERWIEGPAAARIRLAKGPWTREKILKKGAKHAVFLVMAWLIAHIFISYFVSTDRLWQYMLEGPNAHPVVFLWALVPTVILYFNFFWFREQLCLIVCPYGRLQSVLQDDDTININYDKARGEPRGKKSDPNAGDCVDCGRCVAVCPTDIDIRNGLQLECIGCAHCIDACNDIMLKIGRPTGLVRYDSLRGLREGKRRLLRPRLAYYAVAGAVGLAVAIFLFSGRTSFEANIVRLSAAPYILDGEMVRNQVMVHVVNKNPEPSTLDLSLLATPDKVDVLLPQKSVDLKPFGDHKLPVVVTFPASEYVKGMKVELHVKDSQSGRDRDLELKLIGPNNGNHNGTP